MQKHKRSLFAQFRLGILPLKIETGRYDNTPVDERICVQCESEAVENEQHFVLHCPKYVNLREVLYREAAKLIFRWLYGT